MATGARVALRANAIVLAAVVFIVGSAPDGLATLRRMLVETVAHSRSLEVRLLLAGVSVGLAHAAVPRLMLGSYGWQRSLPADPRMLRRACIAAVALVQFPVTIYAVIAAAIASPVYRVQTDVWYVGSFPVMAFGIAVAVIPDRRVIARILGAGAASAAVVGSWPSIAAAIGLVVIGDRIARGWGERKQGKGLRLAHWHASSALSIWIAASWRAIGARDALGIVFAPAIVCGFAHFIVRNNRLAAEVAGAPVRVCGAIAAALLVAAASNTLLRKRPPWPWARSLPWGSMQRVSADVVVMILPLLLVPLALAPANMPAALCVAGFVPVAAAVGAASMRAGASRQTGAAGESFVIVGTIGAIVALWPLMAAVAFVATPLALRWAAARERGADGTRWEELHHTAAGDSGWFTA